MKLVALAAAGLACLCTGAHAQQFEPTGYVGVGLGSFDYEEDVDDIGEFSDSASVQKLYGGYRFGEHFALEAAYAKTDTVSESASEFIPGLGTVNATIGVEFDAISLRALALAPFSWGSLFGGAGYFDGDGDASIAASLGNVSVREEATTSENGLTVQAGLQWEWETVDLRVEYEWWDIDDADASALGLAVHVKF